MPSTSQTATGSSKPITALNTAKPSQTGSERRTAEWRDFLHAAGGQSCDRELATALQQRAASCFSGLPAAGSGGVRARLGRLAACAHPTSSAGQAARGEKANAELTSNPDHPMGADQCQRSAHI